MTSSTVSSLILAGLSVVVDHLAEQRGNDQARIICALKLPLVAQQLLPLSRRLLQTRLEITCTDDNLVLAVELAKRPELLEVVRAVAFHQVTGARPAVGWLNAMAGVAEACSSALISFHCGVDFGFDQNLDSRLFFDDYLVLFRLAHSKMAASLKSLTFGVVLSRELEVADLGYVIAYFPQLDSLAVRSKRDVTATEGSVFVWSCIGITTLALQDDGLAGKRDLCDDLATLFVPEKLQHLLLDIGVADLTLHKNLHECANLTRIDCTAAAGTYFHRAFSNIVPAVAELHNLEIAYLGPNPHTFGTASVVPSRSPIALNDLLDSIQPSIQEYKVWGVFFVADTALGSFPSDKVFDASLIGVDVLIQGPGTTDELRKTRLRRSVEPAGTRPVWYTFGEW